MHNLYYIAVLLAVLAGGIHDLGQFLKGIANA